MFESNNSKSLSQLWPDFDKRFLPLCKQRALDCMEADRYSSFIVFGTALDLCEDVFLRSFDRFQLSLVLPDRSNVIVKPVLSDTCARLLVKLTAFESACVSERPEEAGQDGKWLIQMGSSAFDAADRAWICPDRKGRDTGDDLEKILFARRFCTLPVLFERLSFVVPRELPPWSGDLLEDTYVRNVWQENRGAAICLSNAKLQDWKKSLSEESVRSILRGLLPGEVGDSSVDPQSKGGRPSKQERVSIAYKELNLDKMNLPLKEECRRLEEHLGDSISRSTLSRVRRTFRTD